MFRIIPKQLPDFKLFFYAFPVDSIINCIQSFTSLFARDISQDSSSLLFFHLELSNNDEEAFNLTIIQLLCQFSFISFFIFILFYNLINLTIFILRC